MWLVSSIKQAGVLVPLLFFSLPIFAQSNIDDWSNEMHEHYALLKDGSNNGDFDQAYQALHWFMEYYPEAHESVYIFGVKIVKGKIEETSDSAIKFQFFNELLQLYDDRINYFGNQSNVLLRKTLDVYSIGREIQNPAIDSVRLNCFNQLHQINPGAFGSGHLLAYMDVVSHNYKENNLDQEILLKYYITITEAFFNLEEKEDNDETRRQQGLVDKMFMDLVTINCAEIENKFGGKLVGENKSYYARIVVKLSLNFNCTNSENFINALALLYAEKPTIKIATYLANKMELQDDFIKAEQYLIAAYNLAQSPDQKAETAIALAEFYYKRGEKIKSRKYVILSLQVKPGWDEAYGLWGDLYYSSFNDCKKGESQVQDRLVFIAAYDKYKAGGQIEKMELARQQFPDSEHIHFEGYLEKEELQCGCWIKEKVSLTKRPI